MTTTPLSPDRFRAFVEAYGARPSHWPDAHREAMAALAASESWARDIVAEAETLDALMDASVVLGDAARVRAQVIAAAPKTLKRVRLWHWLRATGLGVGLAASAASGLAVGIVLAPAAAVRMQDQDTDPLQEAAAWIQPSDDTGQTG